MLQEKLPGVKVIIDKNRIKSANIAVDSGMDTVILDDGFQQWGIIKDLDIVTINALQPLGNFQMIPRGILREPADVMASDMVFEEQRTSFSIQAYGQEYFRHSVAAACCRYRAIPGLSGCWTACGRKSCQNSLYF